MFVLAGITQNMLFIREIIVEVDMGGSGYK